jgi:L-aspartate oxidase
MSGYHLTREGGHSARRVIHVADATGSAVQDTLTRKVRQIPTSRLESHIAIDLITGEQAGQARIAVSALMCSTAATAR